MAIKALMYHYIRPQGGEYANIRSLNIDLFRRQLDFFMKEYGVLSRDSFIHAINSGKVKKGVVLTFDDGFKDHYDFVLPELLKRKIWGLFYIPTGHYKVNGIKKMLGVHRIHHLLGKYDAGLLYNSVNESLSSEMLDEEKIQEFDKEIYKEQASSNDEYKFKRLLNYYIKYEYRDVILDSNT